MKERFSTTRMLKLKESNSMGAVMKIIYAVMSKQFMYFEGFGNCPLKYLFIPVSEL